MVATQLKSLRLKRNMTQKELARGIVSHTYISLYENNKKEIPLDLIELFADKLGVSVRELLGTDRENKIKSYNEKLDKILDLLYRYEYKQAKETLTKLIDDEELQQYEEPYMKCKVIEIYYFILTSQLSLAEKKIAHLDLKVIEKYELAYFRYLRFIGALQYKKNQFANSIRTYARALEIEVEKPLYDLALLYYNYSLSFWKINEYQRSFYYISKASDLFSELGKITNLSESLIVLGGIYYKQKQYNLSLETYTRILNILEVSENDYVQAQVLHNIGVVYNALGEYEKAEDNWLEALKLKRNIGNEKELITTLYNLGKYYFEIKVEEKFIKIIKELKELFNDNNFPLIEGSTYKLIGNFYKDKMDIRLFKYYFQKSIDTYENGNLFIEAGKVSFGLAKELTDLGFYKRSAEFFMKQQEKVNNI